MSVPIRTLHLATVVPHCQFNSERIVGNPEVGKARSLTSGYAVIRLQSNQVAIRYRYSELELWRALIDTHLCGNVIRPVRVPFRLATLKHGGLI
jgi:hypothetical protein